MSALGDFWGSFTGSRQQGDINQGQQQSQGYLDRGRAGARTAIEGGRDSAMGTIDPFIQSARRGQQRYEDTLGLNGQGARQTAFQTGYLDDPALAYRNQQTGTQINALMRKYNSGGQGVNSGAAALGAGRVQAENFNRDWGGYQDRLQGMSQQGQQAAQFGAGIQYGAGKDLADVETGYGNTSAGNAVSAANARAAGRSTFTNNLLGLAGMAGRAYGAMGGGGGGGNYYNQGQQWTNPDTGRTRY